LGIDSSVATAGGRERVHGDRLATQSWGSIMIARILLCLSLLLSTVPACAKVDWTDLWRDPSESGWGVNLVQSDAFMFATFFIYGPSGQPTWYTAEMTWDQPQLALVGPLYTFTGGTVRQSAPHQRCRVPVLGWTRYDRDRLRPEVGFARDRGTTLRPHRRRRLQGSGEVLRGVCHGTGGRVARGRGQCGRTRVQRLSAARNVDGNQCCAVLIGA
jgi:hypothetical protein